MARKTTRKAAAKSAKKGTTRKAARRGPARKSSARGSTTKRATAAAKKGANRAVKSVRKAARSINEAVKKLSPENRAMVGDAVRAVAEKLRPRATARQRASDAVHMLADLLSAPSKPKR